MLRRRVAADDDGGAGRPRLFAAPRLLVGLAAGKCASDCESPAARSPTSPFNHHWGAFPALGVRSPRSPRSWDSHRVGLGGIVESLAEPAAGGPMNRLLGTQVRAWIKLPQRLVATTPCASQPRPTPPELGKVEATPVPCSRSYGDLKSGPEPIVPGGGARLGASSRSTDLGRFPAPGSLPASIVGSRRYVGSVSATEVEGSEDYTCIIAHGSNPKTTRIFGDCILEPVTVLMPDGESMEAVEVKEAAESYWLVKCSEEEFSESLSRKENLDGNTACIYRGDNAICSVNCRDQAILVEVEEEINTEISSFSTFGSSSSFKDDIFMAGVVVLTESVDAQVP